MSPASVPTRPGRKGAKLELLSDSASRGSCSSAWPPDEAAAPLRWGVEVRELRLWQRCLFPNASHAAGGMGGSLREMVREEAVQKH